MPRVVPVHPAIIVALAVAQISVPGPGALFPDPFVVAGFLGLALTPPPGSVCFCGDTPIRVLVPIVIAVPVKPANFSTAVWVVARRPVPGPGALFPDPFVAVAGVGTGDNQRSNSRFHDFIFLFLFIINIEKSRPFIVRDFS